MANDTTDAVNGCNCRRLGKRASARTETPAEVRRMRQPPSAGNLAQAHRHRPWDGHAKARYSSSCGISCKNIGLLHRTLQGYRSFAPYNQCKRAISLQPDVQKSDILAQGIPQALRRRRKVPILSGIGKFTHEKGRSRLASPFKSGLPDSACARFTSGARCRAGCCTCDSPRCAADR